MSNAKQIQILFDVALLQSRCMDIENVSCSSSFLNVGGLSHWSMSIEFWFNGEVKHTIDLKGVFMGGETVGEYRLKMLLKHGFGR